MPTAPRDEISIDPERYRPLILEDFYRTSIPMIDERLERIEAKLDLLVDHLLKRSHSSFQGLAEEPICLTCGRTVDKHMGGAHAFVTEA